MGKKPTDDEIKRVREYICTERRFHSWRVMVNPENPEDLAIPEAIICTDCEIRYEVVKSDG